MAPKVYFFLLCFLKSISWEDIKISFMITSMKVGPVLLNFSEVKVNSDLTMAAIQDCPQF